MATSELAASYAALILADEGIAITADKISSLVSAAKVPEFQSVWATLFAKALEGQDVKQLLLNVGSGPSPSAGAAGASAGAAAGGDAAAADAAAESESEEESDGGDFDLFG